MSYVKKNSTLTWNLNITPSPVETVYRKQKRENNTQSPLDMERMLLANLRRGDKAEAQNILVNLLKFYYLEVRNNFSAFRLKALELAVLLSRAVADPKNIMDNTSLETTNRCLKKIEDSSSLEEIIDFLSGITERMSGMIFSFHGVRHYSALRKAERYIWMHYTRKLSLKEIATASGLSAPYFSTVFKEEMGENLSNYLNRLRVEKAASLLVSTSLPISEIAVTCGFEDQSWFSKIFRNNTGFTPGKYREHGMAVEGSYLG
ncbi:MAG: AraC family transcriptional regulator [Treponema sp.]|nr:AraC family transcriptional regulator [Treponema sp.]